MLQVYNIGLFLLVLVWWWTALPFNRKSVCLIWKAYRKAARLWVRLPGRLEALLTALRTYIYTKYPSTSLANSIFRAGRLRAGNQQATRRQPAGCEQAHCRQCAGNFQAANNLLYSSPSQKYTKIEQPFRFIFRTGTRQGPSRLPACRPPLRILFPI